MVYPVDFSLVGCSYSCHCKNILQLNCGRATKIREGHLLISNGKYSNKLNYSLFFGRKTIVYHAFWVEYYYIWA